MLSKEKKKKPQKLPHSCVNIRIIYICGWECKLIHSKSIIYVVTLAQGIFTYHKLPTGIFFLRFRPPCACVHVSLKINVAKKTLIPFKGLTFSDGE